MALLDSADLLARCKRGAARPAVDEDKGPTDTTADDLWFALLSEAQIHWIAELASHVPDMAGLYTIEKLTTADAGVSYDFVAEPLGHYEIRESKTGRLLVPGPEWDPGADFVPAGQKIRFPGQLPRTFGDGPYARYVKQPGVIASATQPTLLPTNARLLLVHHALGLWASRGGLRDPRPFWDLEAKTAFGNPSTGEVGIIGALKLSAFMAGASAVPSESWYW